MLSTDFSYTPCTARTKVGFTQLCYSLVRRYVLKISTMLFLQFHKCFVASFLLIPRKANRRNIKQFPPRVRIMKKSSSPFLLFLLSLLNLDFPFSCSQEKSSSCPKSFCPPLGKEQSPLLLLYAWGTLLSRRREGGGV